MALKDLTTDLKSLRFGKDRIGGGSSREPFNTNSINGTPGDTGGPDFLLRANTLQRTGEDLSRIGQFMISPKGLQFAAKQNVLSRTAVKLQRNSENGNFNPINEGIYLPTSTLAQIAVNSTGGHLLKQGINPFRNTSEEGSNIIGSRRQGSTPNSFLDRFLNAELPLALPIYVRQVSNFQSPGDNRLVQLAEKKIGIGRNTSNTPFSSFLDNLIGGVGNTVGSVASGIFNNLFKPPSNDGLNIAANDNEILRYTGGPGSALGLGETSLKRYVDTQAYNTSEFRSKYELLSYSDIIGRIPANQQGLSSTTLTDFRTIPLGIGGYSSINSRSLDYSNPNERLGGRVNMLDPGRRRKNLISYVNGVDDGQQGALDKINALPLYQASNVNSQTSVINDLVKFRIGILDNKKNEKTYIHFRSFINSFSDSYNANWSEEQFMGRGEKFYRYGGFDRDIKMDWTVAALSREELIPQYQKLNFLASSLAPDYSDDGYMQGNLAYLTMGGYCYEQPGFISSLSITPPKEAPFEINVGDSQFGSGKKAGQTAKELPMYVDVSISFKPIHNFVPKIQQNDYEGLAIPGGGKYISTFGKERYIALKNALNNQYDSFNFAPPAAGEEQKRKERVTGSGASASIGVNVGNAVNSLNDQIETFGNIGSNPGY